MHEMGIVLHVAKTLDETAKEENLTKIGSVTLQVGEVSGIMTDLFCDCWDYFKKKHPVLRKVLNPSIALFVERLMRILFEQSLRKGIHIMIG